MDKLEKYLPTILGLVVLLTALGISVQIPRFLAESKYDLDQRLYMEEQLNDTHQVIEEYKKNGKPPPEYFVRKEGRFEAYLNKAAK